MTVPRDPGALIGESPLMRELRSMIDRVAGTTLSVLISGETGSGKELVARAVHRGSKRGGALVALNVCAVGDTMFEASLFGHVRGAFTGAVGDSPGFLAEANGGTLFLDEISGLAPTAQAKLLRAVETKEFRPVGARMDRRSDFRVVAATNEELRPLVATGRFRADLLQRLAGVSVHVPPLRARPEDLPALIEHFATGVTPHSRPIEFSVDAVGRMAGYTWPGNVRELRHVVECAIALASTPVIRARDVEFLLDPVSRGSVTERRDERRHGELLVALEESQWDVDEVARRLGVHRATIYRRLKRAAECRPGPGPTLPAAPDATRLHLEA